MLKIVKCPSDFHWIPIVNYIGDFVKRFRRNVDDFLTCCLDIIPWTSNGPKRLTILIPKSPSLLPLPTLTNCVDGKFKLMFP